MLYGKQTFYAKYLTRSSQRSSVRLHPLSNVAIFIRDVKKFSEKPIERQPLIELIEKEIERGSGRPVHRYFYSLFTSKNARATHSRRGDVFATPTFIRHRAPQGPSRFLLINELCVYIQDGRQLYRKGVKNVTMAESFFEA